MSGLDIQMAQKVLDSQPFSGLVGARITAFGDGAATLEVDIRQELQQQNGFVHGGVLSYAADNSITFAAGTTLGLAGTDRWLLDPVHPSGDRSHPDRPRHRRAHRPSPGGGPLRSVRRGGRRCGSPVRGRPGNRALRRDALKGPSLTSRATEATEAADVVDLAALGDRTGMLIRGRERLPVAW